MNAHITEIESFDEAMADLSRSIAQRLRRYDVACARIADLDCGVDDWVLAAQLAGHRLMAPLPIAVSEGFVVARLDGSARSIVNEVRLAEALRGPRCSDPKACRTSVYFANTIHTMVTHPSSAHRG